MDEFYNQFLDKLSEADKQIFKVYEMKFTGENYPLCEKALQNLFGTITENGENNKEKFLAISALFFTLIEIYG